MTDEQKAGKAMLSCLLLSVLSCIGFHDMLRVSQQKKYQSSKLNTDQKTSSIQGQ